jgi:restriction endonuclease
MRIKNLVFVGLIIGASVYADGINMNNQSMGNSNGGMMKQENAQMFEKHKSMLMQMQQQRMQILQNGYNCIFSVGNRDALRTCEMTEKQSMEQLKDQFKQQRESMKQEHGNMGPINGNRQNQQPAMGQMPMNMEQPR